MIAELGDLLGLSQSFLAAAFVTFLRVGPVVGLLFATSQQLVPHRVLFALAFALTLALTPSTREAGPLLLSLPLIATETLSGLVFGIGLRLLIVILQVAATIMAQSTSLAQIFGGATESQPAIGHLLTMAGFAFLAATGFLTRIAVYVLQSYDIVPMGMLIDAETLYGLGLAEVSRAFQNGFMLAAPMVVAGLVYNVALGVINRAMPQLMVSFVGAPAITLGALLLLFVCAPFVIGLWGDWVGAFVQNPFGGR